MSEIETKIGKLRFLAKNEEAESFAKSIMSDLMTEKPDYYDSYSEWLADERYKQYIYVNSSMFEIIENKDLSYDDIYLATKNNDGTISYLVQYYSGCCGFSEAIEKALNKMEGGE